MPDFIYTLPLAPLAIGLSAFTMLITIGSLFILKPVLDRAFEAGESFNEALGHGSAAFNLFFGLLLGLLTVTAFSNYERVKQTVQSEALAVGQLYSDLVSYPEPMRSDIRFMLRDYVLYTAYRDWDAHRNGRYLTGGSNRVDAIRLRLSDYNPESNGQAIVHEAVLTEFAAFIQARQQRLNGVILRIPNVLWYTVIVGLFVNVALFLCLTMKFRHHLIVGGITSFFMGVILFVVISLDAPMRGPAGLQPVSFITLWETRMAWDEGAS